MQFIYAADTDTLEIAFDQLGPVAKTVDGPTDDLLLEFDEEDRLIGMTIERASRTTPFEAIQVSPHFEAHGEPAQAER